MDSLVGQEWLEIITTVQAAGWAETAKRAVQRVVALVA